jgi:stage II sporulation protein AB (anti-sigma F factor)
MDLHERLPARPESIAALRHAVVDFACSSGASERKREDIALAVSEAVSNAVLHARRGAFPGEVAVQARRDAGWLEIVVCDEGHGMIPRDDSPGIGLGLPLIYRVTDRFHVERAATMSGMRLRMAFSLA